MRIWVLDEDDEAEVTLSELEVGSVLGEMAGTDGGTRSASATALVDSMLHRLPRKDFEGVLVDYPQAALR